jgi:4-diphosphocytidyl-2-C-methyl-D-erythritol kinase
MTPVLRAFAPAKVNLCLYVGRAREDGYHPLVSVVQPLGLGDDLVLEPAPGAADEVICPGVRGENLAATALARYREDSGWDGPAQRVTIHKRTPVAAGMGGGSSDAAAALRLVAAAAADADRGRLARLAPVLGADVSSLLEPRRCLMTGVGEHVRPLPEPAGPFGVLVLPGDAPLSTPAVYRAFDELGLGRTTAALAALEREAADGRFEPVNDLEAAALALRPEIRATLDDARSAGADLAMVSGSGPTVVGFFATPAAAAAAADALRERHPRAVATAPYAGRPPASAEAVRHNGGGP